MRLPESSSMTRSKAQGNSRSVEGDHFLAPDKLHLSDANLVFQCLLARTYRKTAGHMVQLRDLPCLRTLVVGSKKGHERASARLLRMSWNNH